MSLAASATLETRPRVNPWLAAWVAALAVLVALFLLDTALPWAFDYPKGWIVDLRRWISAFMKWLINDFSLGLFTFKEFTRGIAWLIDWPLAAARALLAEGFFDGQGSQAVLLWPPLSWLAVSGVAVIMGLHAAGWRLALLVGLCCSYLAVFGQWQSAMVTLSSIVIAVPFGIAGGLLLGIAAFRSRRFERALTPRSI